MKRTEDSHLRGWTVSRRITWRGIAIGLAVLLAAGIGATLILGGDDAQPASSDDPVISDSAERTDSSVAADATQGQGAEPAPLVATNDAGEIVPPKSTTKKPATPTTPTNPANPTTPADPTTPPEGLTPEEQAYLEETKQVVEENTGELAQAVEIITEALSDGDKGGLTSMLADGEGGAFAADLAERYPQFLETSPGTNVNIFATSDTTVYFAYVLVTWEDGGIVSQHTIPVPLRYVDGEWRLTSLGDTADDLRFVQSVTL